ncbi:histone deacetylase family protein [Orrella marina]|uniref:Histone deacetylase n=1 Tax=Orrella marina TaxID=2163011 RepID=A0A2R4XIT6_9BURK|nr:histone deacetylase [Orrella marina]AWB33720.1 histone deacetylase [Orrella marina]
MQVFYSDHFVLPLPPEHRFPMQKYRLLRQKVSTIPGIVLSEATGATDSQLLLAHDPAYLQSLIRGTLDPRAQREIGFPWSEAMVERSRRSVGATIAASRVALQEGVAVNLAGGTHHAYRDHGSGFCVFNDVAVAARSLQRELGRRSMRIAIIDLDVHQGDGTASIFANDPTVYTLSVHGERNFPFRKQTSRLDIALPDGTQDTTYLEALRHGLQTLENQWEPEFIFFLAGADPHKQDRLGRMNLTDRGMKLRDAQVFEFAKKHQLPIAITMAGGYGLDINTTVAMHLQTVQAAATYWNDYLEHPAHPPGV